MLIYILIALLLILFGILGYLMVQSSLSVFALSIWFQVWISGARISLFELVRLQLEKVDQQEIKKLADCIIMAHRAGIELNLDKLNNHRHLGGDVFRVTKALIMAANANIPLSFELATAIDLAKMNLLEALQKNVNPVIRDTPEIIAKPKDGIELKVQCRVTMRANIANIMKGANEETILARVGEGIVGAIGSAEKYQDILENPYQISDLIMKLDRDNDGVPDVHQNTAFFVISIDITNINLGQNVGVRLAIEQAEADAVKARADAETRRANAVKREEEMKNRITEMEARLLEAEADIPLAIADALRKGRSDNESTSTA